MNRSCRNPAILAALTGATAVLATGYMSSAGRPPIMLGTPQTSANTSEAISIVPGVAGNSTSV